ncbi:putative transcription factor C2H2 family [Helianthus anomalus]
MSTNDSLTFHWQDDDLDDDNFQIRHNTRLYMLVLFSIILLVTIIFFLYSRCTISSRASSTTSSFYHTSPPSSQLRGLNAAAINSLPITIHRQALSNTNDTTLECSICLGVFEEGEKVKVLPVCYHRYHCECVDKWLVTHSSCPICRTSVRVDSHV